MANQLKVIIDYLEIYKRQVFLNLEILYFIQLHFHIIDENSIRHVYSWNPHCRMENMTGTWMYHSRSRSQYEKYVVHILFYMSIRTLSAMI